MAPCTGNDIFAAMTSPVQLMHDAFARRDASAVRALFAEHAELRKRIDEPVFSFDSPAIVAFANDPAMVEVLLEVGADPNRRSDWWAGGFHALHSATGTAAARLLAAGAIPDACAASHLDRIDLLTRLLADDPARVHERGGDGQTPLHFAQSREMVDVLLSAGADIDARDVDHRATAAEWMLDRRQGLARYLVDHGASTDIFLAAALGLTERARAMAGSDPALLDLRTGQGAYGEQPPSSYHIYFWSLGSGLSPLQVAAKFGHRETVGALLALASSRQRLVFAAASGDDEVARAVLRDDPAVITAMTEDDHRALADAAWRGDARAVALMLELGFDPRVRGHDSGTALHCAAWDGSTDVVALLLQHPDAHELVAIRDLHYDATPLGWCCHGSRFGNRSHDHAGVARLLLAAGAQPGPDSLQASPEVMAVIAP